MRDLLQELVTRVAELERKSDNMLRPGPVQARKKIDGEWFVRTKIGGTDEKPTLSPWLPYAQQNGGPKGLNVYRVPQIGENMMMVSPTGDPRQALLVPMFWSNEHKPPSDKEDEVVVTHPKFRLSLADGTLKIESSEVIEFNSAQTIRLVGGGSEVELKGGHINIVSGDIHTVGKTHLGVESKDEQGKKKAVMEGLLIGPRVKLSEKDATEDPKVGEIMAAIAAAGGGGGGGD
ncbi:phage baseplate assembly protein V [Rhodoplanes sp. TEM]|uniref:Phage baseplate assembly protein V n=1 Tax=Rhodoplanes tepidamans TaxID=200616 RepID=A0ABT5J546_RHOTP|nr:MULTISPECIES: phage baseplate assembly protein V [Rhodoplanes]MDC7784770.1 phage baseplate assembly protein V [Rhodoplanes tepidamans]MDC7982237.1 phage baseplate assembly protein V [Rhodoplanes sp. TEM]MDQ0356244.1 phage baseplate assembly protein gpV [Rhodoplanes tepidamans]